MTLFVLYSLWSKIICDVISFIRDVVWVEYLVGQRADPAVSPGRNEYTININFMQKKYIYA